MSESLTEHADRVASALRSLEESGSTSFREQLQPRYGIVAAGAFGTPMAEIKRIAKALGRDHQFALELWQTGWYEARLLASLVDEADRVTPEQMDRWCSDFDNWAVVDTLCFNLFDRTPYALTKVAEWAALEEEYPRRAAFALLASVALHRKDVPDQWFVDQLPLIENAAGDGRNFVKKGVSWALRSVGKRRSPVLKAEATRLAKQLAASSDPPTRWVGKDALRALTKPSKR